VKEVSQSDLPNNLFLEVSLRPSERDALPLIATPRRAAPDIQDIHNMVQSCIL
jgi:hypothetical protein